MRQNRIDYALSKLSTTPRYRQTLGGEDEHEWQPMLEYWQETLRESYLRNAVASTPLSVTPLIRTITHTVAVGDSLWTVASEHYGRAPTRSELEAIAEASSIRVDTPLQIGQKLTISPPQGGMTETKEMEPKTPAGPEPEGVDAPGQNAL